MIVKETVVVNELGLHARPASKLVRMAAKHQSSVYITYGSDKINAKSIMGLMMLAVEQGGRILIEVDGEDEEELMEKMLTLIANGFDENEKIISEAGN